MHIVAQGADAAGEALRVGHQAAALARRRTPRIVQIDVVVPAKRFLDSSIQDLQVLYMARSTWAAPTWQHPAGSSGSTQSLRQHPATAAAPTQRP